MEIETDSDADELNSHYEKDIEDSDVESDMPQREREDVFLVLTMEKDLRHFESVRIKAQYFTGITIRVKALLPPSVENVLKAIEIDQSQAMKKFGYAGSGV